MAAGPSRLLPDSTGRPGVGIRPSWEPVALGVLVVLALAFGYNVLHRSAFSDRKRTDAGVFFRAGYSVREGQDPYQITDDNEWYFLYAPGVAAVFLPLADPPHAGTPGVSTWGDPPGSAPTRETLRGWFMPYPVSVVLWYAISVACLVLTVHWLVRAMQNASEDPHIRALTPRHGGWWNIRLWPVLACLPDILSTLSRGQISTVLLACMAAGVWLWSSNRRTLAGFWWGFAAFLKVFPGLLVVLALRGRDARLLLGYAVCFVLTMVVLPLAAFGPADALRHSETFVSRVLLAGLVSDEDANLQAGASFRNTDNQSIQGSLHNLTNITTPRRQRPDEPAAWVKAAHLLGFVVLLGGTLLVGGRGGVCSTWNTRGGVCSTWNTWARAAGWGRRVDPEDTPLELVLRVGMLCCVMIACLPMSHRHYAVFLLPGVCGLTFVSVMGSRLGFLSGAGLWVIPALPIVLAVPKIEQEGFVRDLPLVLVCTLVVWTLCAITLHRLGKTRGRLEGAAPV